jgi:hypothetical protein
MPRQGIRDDETVRDFLARKRQERANDPRVIALRASVRANQEAR